MLLAKNQETFPCFHGDSCTQKASFRLYVSALCLNSSAIFIFQNLIPHIRAAVQNANFKDPNMLVISSSCWQCCGKQGQNFFGSREHYLPQVICIFRAQIKHCASQNQHTRRVVPKCQLENREFSIITGKLVMMKFHYHYCFSPKLIIHSQKFTNFYIEHNYTCTSSQFHYLSHSSLTTFDT